MVEKTKWLNVETTPEKHKYTTRYRVGVSEGSSFIWKEKIQEYTYYIYEYICPFIHLSAQEVKEEIIPLNP